MAPADAVNWLFMEKKVIFAVSVAVKNRHNDRNTRLVEKLIDIVLSTQVKFMDLNLILTCEKI